MIAFTFTPGGTAVALYSRSFFLRESVAAASGMNPFIFGILYISSNCGASVG